MSMAIIAIAVVVGVAAFAVWMDMQSDPVQVDQEALGLRMIEEMADFLIDTRSPLQDGIMRVFGPGITQDDLSIAMLNRLDELAFRCDVCGYWCPSDEHKDDSVCIECAETVK